MAEMSTFCVEIFKVPCTSFGHPNTPAPLIDSHSHFGMILIRNRIAPSK